MKRQICFYGKLLAFTTLALAIFCTPLQAQNINGLQIIFIQGKVKDAEKTALDNQPIELYDYLSPGNILELGNGAKVELSTADGKKVYVAEGPGFLALERNGYLTFKGKILSPRSAKPLLAGATVAEKPNVGLGATVMRSEKQAPVKQVAAKQVSVQIRQAGGRSKLMRLYSGYYALVIGCSDYQNGWPKLPNPVRDAKEMAKTLEGMGWQVTLLENPDHKALQRALNNLITGPGRNEEQGIFLWFSGHGHTLAQADGSKLGYIVPVDAPNPNRDEVGFMERAISMRQIETVALRVRSKHLLMAFDSCFSGSLFNITRAVAPPFIEEKVAYPVREFITAGNENEEVPDKSMFKTVFVQGLVDGFADLNKDGYVTGQELGAYLQENVVNYTRKAQHPQFGKINNPKLDKGDFVFVVKEP